MKCLTKYQQLCDTCVDSNGRIGRTPARVQARARVVIIRAGHGAVFSIHVTITGTGIRSLIIGVADNDNDNDGRGPGVAPWLTQTLLIVTIVISCVTGGPLSCSCLSSKLF